jgi:hypothetical protein
VKVSVLDICHQAVGQYCQETVMAIVFEYWFPPVTAIHHARLLEVRRTPVVKGTWIFYVQGTGHVRLLLPFLFRVNTSVDPEWSQPVRRQANAWNYKPRRVCQRNNGGGLGIARSQARRSCAFRNRVSVACASESDAIEQG